MPATLVADERGESPEALAISPRLFDPCVREEGVAMVLLAHCISKFSRALIWVERLSTVLVWRGYGEGSDSGMLAALRIELDEPSMFSLAIERRGAVVVNTAANSGDELVFTSLPEMPEAAAVVPIFRGDELLFFLYVDSGTGGIEPSTVRELEQVATAAGEALQRIRSLRSARGQQR